MRERAEEERARAAPAVAGNMHVAVRGTRGRLSPAPAADYVRRMDLAPFDAPLGAAAPGPPAGAPPSAEPRHLDPRVVRLWRTSGMLWTVVPAFAALVVYVLLRDRVPLLWILPAVILAIGTFYLTAWVPRAYAAWRFEIRTDDVRLQHGVLWRRTSVVPHARIQHVDTQHGPLTRAYGLSSIVLYTAGHVGASIEIPGLPHEEAEALRERLGALSAADDAV